MAEAAFQRSPLEPMADALAGARIEGTESLVLEEKRFLAQINLRGDAGDKAFQKGVRKALGLAVPVEPNTVASADGLDILWLGPDEWLVVGETGRESAIVTSLRTELAGQHVAVTDVSANRTCIRLAGRRAREILAKGCTLDFHPRAFEAGRCAQTLVARAQVIIQLVDGGPASADFRLFVRGSFAQYLAGWLVDASREYRA